MKTLLILLLILNLVCSGYAKDPFSYSDDSNMDYEMLIYWNISLESVRIHKIKEINIKFWAWGIKKDPHILKLQFDTLGRFVKSEYDWYMDENWTDSIVRRYLKNITVFDYVQDSIVRAYEISDSDTIDFTNSFYASKRIRTEILPINQKKIVIKSEYGVSKDCFEFFDDGLIKSSIRKYRRLFLFWVKDDGEITREYEYRKYY